METRALTLDDLLSRVALTGNLHEAIAAVVPDFQLGQLKSIEPLLVGHDELNTVVRTTTRDVVFKFFNKKKKPEFLRATIRAMQNLNKAGIPVPQLIADIRGNYLYQLPATLGKGFLCVTKYFAGHTFNETKPTADDIQALTAILAKMHTLKFPTKPEYDFWLLKYLSQEFKTKQSCLTKEDKKLVTPYAALMSTLDHSKLSRGIGHFDLHRDNARKNDHGQYCLFDLATVDYDVTLFDLATFLGLFCLNPTNSYNQNLQIFRIATEEYRKTRLLTAYEQNHLWTCIRGIYASNVLAAYYLYKTEGDTTEENMKWYRLGKWGLKTFTTPLMEMHSPTKLPSGISGK